MRVGFDLQSQRLLTILTTPYLPEAQEYALHTRKAVDDWCFLAVQRHLIRKQTNGDSAQVADVFAERELTIYAQIVEGLKRVVLFN